MTSIAWNLPGSGAVLGGGRLSTVTHSQSGLSGGYINLVGNARFGQHSGGSNVLPSRQFQFAITYRF